MSRGLQLLLLSCACSLAPAAREIVVECSEDVVLPCTALWDPQVSYTVYWAKPPCGSKMIDSHVECKGKDWASLLISQPTSHYS